MIIHKSVRFFTKIFIINIIINTIKFFIILVKNLLRLEWYKFFCEVSILFHVTECKLWSNIDLFQVCSWKYFPYIPEIIFISELFTSINMIFIILILFVYLWFASFFDNKLRLLLTSCCENIKRPNTVASIFFGNILAKRLQISPIFHTFFGNL